MSFFDDNKNIGMLLLIMAVLEIALTLVGVFCFDPYKGADLWKQILVIVGSVLSAVIYAILGLDIMNGSCRFQIGPLFSDVNSKFGLLVAITAAFGMTGVVDGLFSLIAFGGMNIGWFVVGILLIVMAWLMTTGNEEANTVIWIILLIIYIIGIIISVLLCLALIGIPMLLMFIMLITFLLSPEVKSKMGM